MSDIFYILSLLFVWLYHLALAHKFVSSIIVIYYTIKFYVKYRRRKNQKISNNRIKDWKIGDELELSKFWSSIHCKIDKFKKLDPFLSEPDNEISVIMISSHDSVNGKVWTIKDKDVFKNITCELRENRDKILKEVLN